MDAAVFRGLSSPIVVASFPRSGTHLTIDVLRNQFKECRTWIWPGERSDHLYVPLEGLHASHDAHDEAAVLRRARRSNRMTIKTHAMPDFAELRSSFPHWADWIEREGRRVYVYRDGREVMVSLYLGRNGMVPDAEDVTFSQFLRMSYLGSVPPRAWAEHVEAWFASPGVIRLNYRDLICDTRGQLDRLSDSLKLTPDYRDPLLPPPIRNRWHSRWIRLTRMRPASTALVPGRVRAVTSPKWWTVFSADDRRWFHEHAGHALIAAGFEQDDAWVNQTGAPVAER